MKNYVCTVCGYVYDGDIPFQQQPDDYTCPVCDVGREDFAEEDA
ncbi:MAG: rubredoxin [Clostridia bacterium]|nr:rubredoxin [Clostridia bacterium]